MDRRNYQRSPQNNQNRSQTSRQFIGEIFESTRFVNRDQNGNALKCKPIFWNLVLKALYDGDWSVFTKWTKLLVPTDSISAVLDDKPYTIRFYKEYFIVGQQQELTFDERQKEMDNGKSYDDLIFVKGTEHKISYALSDQRAANVLEMCYLFMTRFFEYIEAMPLSDYDTQFAYVDFIGIELITYLALKYMKLRIKEDKKDARSEEFLKFVKSAGKYVFLNFNNLSYKYTSLVFDEKQKNCISALDEGLFQHNDEQRILGTVSIGMRILMKRGIDAVRVVFRKRRTVEVPTSALYISFDQDDVDASLTQDEITEQTFPGTPKSRRLKPNF